MTSNRQNDGIFSSIKAPAMLVAVSAALMISGCAKPPQQDVAYKIDPPENVNTTVGNYVEGKGYQFSWAKTANSVITIPMDVRELAHQKCVADSFEVSFMRTVEFDNEQVIGYFMCRGHGGH